MPEPGGNQADYGDLRHDGGDQRGGHRQGDQRGGDQRHTAPYCEEDEAVEAIERWGLGDRGVGLGPWGGAEQGREVFGWVVAQQITPTPVHRDAGPFAGRREAPAPGDYGSDLRLLGTKATLAQEDETGRVDDAEHAGSDDAGVCRRIPAVDAAAAACLRSAMVTCERRGGRTRRPDVIGATARNQCRVPHHPARVTDVKGNVP